MMSLKISPPKLVFMRKMWQAFNCFQLIESLAGKIFIKEIDFFFFMRYDCSTIFTVFLQDSTRKAQWKVTEDIISKKSTAVRCANM